ncbi:MAG: 1-deoxy-D-xylulose-5-phosphate synthase [Ruminococcaceae bacterium]|nr:1-deoxy-D-xylulose-5-phosphate synthase [Oscillospiraceae bacterium]
MLLEKIKNPSDLKKLNKAEYPALCNEIRKTLVDNVLKTGGHLASNLGVVEITLAYHLVFDSPKDKIVFDVGHQSYVHKLLTGRYDKFSTIRQFGGLSGFPKPNESKCDAFVAGHASTSVSAALGIARARDLMGDNFNVCAFIGDGALGGGMAYEALNDAGSSKNKLIVILNDNEMSIEKNVGGMSEYLSKLRTTKKYINTKDNVNNILSKMGKVGNVTKNAVSTIKDAFKYSAISGIIFEDLGFKYLGIIDGHNLENLTDVFERAKQIDGPVLIHTFTKKGMGYESAENNPEKFHGVSRRALIDDTDTIDYSAAAGKILVKKANENNKIVALTAAMASGCGLVDFSNKFPKRFFDVGIAEQHMVTMAAGMAKGGLIPFVCVYSTFLQRAYDQIIHDVCLQNLKVIFLIDRAGIVGDDGETHQGIFDLSFLTHIPNMAILAPTSQKELEQMIDYAIYEHNGPIAIRYPKGAISLDDNHTDFEFEKSEIIKDGNDVALFAVGKMNKFAKNAIKKLEEKNISAAHINVRCVKPFDKNTIEEYSKKVKLMVFLEDNLKNGGFASYVITNSDIKCPVLSFGWDDKFIEHGKPSILFEKYKLDENSVSDGIIKALEGEKIE